MSEILCTSDICVSFVSCKLGPPVPFPAFRTFDIHWSKFGACGLRGWVRVSVCFFMEM